MSGELTDSVLDHFSDEDEDVSEELLEKWKMNLKESLHN